MAILVGGIEFAPSSGAVAVTYRPDMQVSRETRDSFGDDIYNTTAAGQTVLAKVHSGSSDYFFTDTQNDGSGTDSVVLTGCGGNGKFTATYLDNGTDITSQIAGAGYTQSSILPGHTVTISIKLTLKAKKSANSGDKYTCRIKGTSVGDPTKVDVVEANLAVK